jgi:hypothetical protein
MTDTEDVSSTVKNEPGVSESKHPVVENEVACCSAPAEPAAVSRRQYLDTLDHSGTLPSDSRLIRETGSTLNALWLFRESTT